MSVPHAQIVLSGAIPLSTFCIHAAVADLERNDDNAALVHIDFILRFYITCYRIVSTPSYDQRAWKVVPWYLRHFISHVVQQHKGKSYVPDVRPARVNEGAVL